MRSVYAVFVLLLLLVMSAQCQQTAKDWNNKGLDLFRQGKYDEAIAAYDKAISLNSKDAATWNNKGLALYDQKKYDEAIQDYDVAISLNPKDAHTWNNKAATLNNQGKYDEAIAACDEAISLDPKYVHAWNNKGNALKALGRTAEADAAFAKAKELGYTAPGSSADQGTTNGTVPSTSTVQSYGQVSLVSYTESQSVDLGNLTSEATHNLIGWGNSQVPPDNPYVSPSGDRTKRYQTLRGNNSLDFYLKKIGIPYVLTFEVEDGACDDSFEVWIDSNKLGYYKGKNHGLNEVKSYQVIIPGDYITDTKVTITFRNKASDNCGLAAVYNVKLTPENTASTNANINETNAPSTNASANETVTLLSFLPRSLAIIEVLK